MFCINLSFKCVHLADATTEGSCVVFVTLEANSHVDLFPSIFRKQQKCTFIHIDLYACL